MKTKIIKVNPKDLKLLEVNARFMKHEEFNKLVQNVKRDNQLTSVPFCCLDEDGRYEVLSGNHRVQAAIEAGLEEIDAMVTDDELSKSQKIGIQLSHNSITGQDDIMILKELYESIDDFDYKKYCGLDDKTLELIEKIQRESLSVYSFDYQILNLLFLPNEVNEIKGIIKQAKQEVQKNKTLTLRMKEYDEFLEVSRDISKGSRIKNSSLAFLALLRLASKHMEEIKDLWLEDAKDKEYVPVSTLIGRSDVTAKDGRVINKALEKLTSKGLIKSKEKDKGLAYLSEYYLENEKKKKEQSK